jgi:hypothetical protein
VFGGYTGMPIAAATTVHPPPSFSASSAAAQYESIPGTVPASYQN